MTGGPVHMNGSGAIIKKRCDKCLSEYDKLEGKELKKCSLCGHDGFTYVKVTRPIVKTLSATLEATPHTILRGQKVLLSWRTKDATEVEIDQGIGPVEPQGWKELSPQQSTTYTITVKGEGGSSKFTVGVQVTVPPPTVMLKAEPAVIRKGQTVTLSWTSSDAEVLDLQPMVGQVRAQDSIILTPQQTTTYILNVRGAGGSATSTAQVEVKALPPVGLLVAAAAGLLVLSVFLLLRLLRPQLPTVEFWADPSTVEPGKTVALRWRSTNVTSVQISPGVGTFPSEGYVSVTPRESTLYKIRATGPRGSVDASLSVTVTIRREPPTAALEAEPRSITKGQSAVLSWKAKYAAKVQIQPDIGEVSPPDSGTKTVSPQETTTYVLIATGPGGTSSAETRVEVVSAPPTPPPYKPPAVRIVNFTVEPTQVKRGQAVTVTWEVANATAVKITPGPGPVGSKGTAQYVPPLDATAFRLLATGEGKDNTTSAQRRIEFLEPPAINFSGTPQISIGQWARLDWSVKNATHIRIDPGFDNLPSQGEENVHPEMNTDYSLTAEGPSGTAAKSVTVRVAPKIMSFEAVKLPRNGCEQVILRWTVRGASTLSIDQGVGIVGIHTYAIVYPVRTTTYTLTAQSVGGSDTHTATVLIQPGENTRCGKP